MTAPIVVDPLTTLVGHLSQWLWAQVGKLTRGWASSLVFKPLAWSSGVNGLYTLSRDLAWSLTGIVAAAAGVRGIAPALSLPGARLPMPVLLERLFAAALMGLVGLWTVRAVLSINNSVVAAVLAQSRPWDPSQAQVLGVLSPVVVLLLGMALVVLMLYLEIFYAVRAIEIFVLTAAIPWFALWWATREDDGPLSVLFRELGAIIFVQSFQAGAFWLVGRLLGGSSWGTLGGFLEVALMWYMTRMPGQLRRLVGIPPVAGRLWR